MVFTKIYCFYTLLPVYYVLTTNFPKQNKSDPPSPENCLDSTLCRSIWFIYLQKAILKSHNFSENAIFIQNDMFFDYVDGSFAVGQKFVW